MADSLKAATASAVGLPKWSSGTGLIAFSSTLFACMALLVRVLSGLMSTGQVVLFRFVVGLGCTLAVFAYRRQGPAVHRKGLLVLRGLFGAGAVYCYFLSIDLLGVGSATLLNYSAPCYAALFSALFLRERITAQLAGGLVIATAGAMVVAYSTADPLRPFTLGAGAWAGMASALLSGAAMTSIRALRSDTDSYTVFFSFCVLGALFALPFALADFRPLTWFSLFTAVGVGLFSFVAQIIFTYAFAFVTASVGSAATQLTPVFSWVLAVFVLDEPLRPLTLGGAFICVLGVLLGTGMMPGRRARG